MPRDQIDNRLDRHRRNITSQCGEDGIIEHLLTLFPSTPKTCLEVGAGDGITLSNTHTLWAQRGWQALLIEGEKRGVQMIEQRAAGNQKVTAVQSFITAQGRDSIDAIAKRTNFPSHIGVLSLDIDSNDLEVFENFRDIVADIVIIEFNHEIPADIAYRDLPGDVFFRHSAKAVETVAIARGYRVVACSGPNAILVREALIAGDIAQQLPKARIEDLFDHDFVRARRTISRMVQSKFITEELAVYGKPDVGLALLVRLSVAFRKLRRLIRGRKAGAPITPARRQNLRAADLWL